MLVNSDSGTLKTGNLLKLDNSIKVSFLSDFYITLAASLVYELTHNSMTQLDFESILI